VGLRVGNLARADSSQETRRIGHRQDHLIGDLGVIEEHSQEWLSHKSRSNPRGRGEPLPYKWEGSELGRGVGGSGESSPVIRRALRLKVR